MDQSTPGPPVFHCLPEFGQIHVGSFDDIVQPSHPLSSPFPLAFALSQHQGLFQGVFSFHERRDFSRFSACETTIPSILWSSVCVYLYDFKLKLKLGVGAALIWMLASIRRSKDFHLAPFKVRKEGWALCSGLEFSSRMQPGQV